MCSAPASSPIVCVVIYSIDFTHYKSSVRLRVYLFMRFIICLVLSWLNKILNVCASFCLSRLYNVIRIVMDRLDLMGFL